MSVTEETPLPPVLMRLDEDGSPILIGQRCQACERVAFPPDPYGCEACGAHLDRLDPYELGAVGRVHAVAVVHRHHREFPATPFTVATIVLDDGPTLKAVLTDDSADIGVAERVRGVATFEDSGIPLRFARAGLAARGGQ